MRIVLAVDYPLGSKLLKNLDLYGLITLSILVRLRELVA